MKVPVAFDLARDTALVIESSQLEVFDSPTCGGTIYDAFNAEWHTPTEDFFSSETFGCHWVRAYISVHNSGAREGKVSLSAFAKTSPHWMVEAGHHGLNTMYVVAGAVVLDSFSMGNDLPVNSRAYPHIWSKSYLNLAPFSFEPGSDYELVFKYSNPQGQSLFGTNDKLAITMLQAREVDRDSRLHLVFSGLMIGGLLLLFLYQLTQWFVYRTKLGITYCFMMLGLLSYILYDDFLIHAFFSTSQVSELWLFVTGSLGLLGFFRFARLTLQAVDYVKTRDKVMKILYGIKLVETGVYISLAIFSRALWSQQLAGVVPEVFRILLMTTLLVFSWVVISHFRENKDTATRAFMYGNLSLVIGVMIVTTQAYLLPFSDITPVRWYLNVIWPIFDYIIEAGIVGMALCFALAVAILVKDREVKIERGYNRRLIDVEMKALRAQMNPHFLFNGLNSIKSFVIDNKRHEASEYLTKFARLIRRVLENSKDSLIPLSREIETLDFYIEMESMRLTDKFSYSIIVDDDVKADLIEVPPTLIQPFVENSIWHGLLPLIGRDAYVKIHVSKHEDGQTQISIEDNGIGREASSLKRVNIPGKRKSLGMEITAERIAMLKELYGFSAELEFIDLKDGHGAANGTRVIISIDQGE